MSVCVVAACARRLAARVVIRDTQRGSKGYPAPEAARSVLASACHTIEPNSTVVSPPEAGHAGDSHLEVILGRRPLVTMFANIFYAAATD